MVSVQLRRSDCLSSNLTSQTRIYTYTESFLLLCRKNLMVRFSLFGDSVYPPTCLSVYKLHRSKVKINPEQRRRRRASPSCHKKKQIKKKNNLQSEPVHTPPCGPSRFSYTVHTLTKIEGLLPHACAFVCVCVFHARENTHTHSLTYTVLRRLLRILYIIQP